MTTTNTTTNRLAFAATIAALCFGAAACGHQDSTTSRPSGSLPHTASSIDLIEAAKANQLAYLRQLRAQHADAARRHTAHRYGDDRRQPNSQPAHRQTPTAHHNPGFDKALLAER